ncbi:hypothetical protein [Actinoplanes awajinensis]|uniref:Uncharacterized protein n=1 Tax=Actinoplanes awajinensis subsp. mycoplanecinus TaxID=135947 RepID=A0A117MQR1_9ACTN|nr:hypothetical protein [Actinoplanes awajinensis]KUL30551.1 hypothetical protein ADL15_24860 [Actinoplanes awajinensis subsp. mycoplanecinus]
MSDLGTEQPVDAPAPAPRRRRKATFIALGVLVAVVLVLVLWGRLNPPSATTMRDTALSGVLATGGPAGWTAVREPLLQSTDNSDVVDAGTWEDRDGVPVLVGDTTFTVVWSVSPGTAEACTALGDWVGNRIVGEARAEAATSCREALTTKPAGTGAFDAYGTEPTEKNGSGRYLYNGWSTTDGLFASLTYEAPTA